MGFGFEAPWPADTVELRIGQLCLDLRYRKVVRPGKEVELPCRMFELLLLFAAEPGVLHTREELLRRVWGEVVVGDANLTQSVSMLRKALGRKRRDWIRTVSRSGYVFEPPESPVAVGSEHTLAEPGRSFHPPRGWHLGLAAAAVVVGMAVLASVALHHLGRSDQTLPESVALVVLGEEGHHTEVAQAARLLEVWLGWKLDLVPSVRRLHMPHFSSASDHHVRTRLITLSAGPLPHGTQRYYLQAHDSQYGGHWRVEGRSAELVTLVESLASKIVAELVPEAAGSDWPAINLEPDQVAQLVELDRLTRVHQWSAVLEKGKDLAEQAPGSAMVHLYLARAMGATGQMRVAHEFLQKARALLVSAPDIIDPALTLWAGTLGVESEQALEVAEQLTEQYSRRTDLARHRAVLLMLNGRPADALDSARSASWYLEPPAERFRWLLLKSYLHLQNGDLHVAARQAEQALDLAVERNWMLERGLASLTLADIDRGRKLGRIDGDYYRQAADLLKQSGAELLALQADLMASFGEAGSNSDADLDTLLARARAAGQTMLEFDALRIIAHRHFHEGDIDRYRRLLEQSASMADAMGSDTARQFALLDAVNESFLRGDIDNMQSGLKQLSEGELQGEARAWVQHFRAAAHLSRGGFVHALDVLDETVLDQAGPAIVQIRECLRGRIYLALGELVEARRNLERCGNSEALVRQLSGAAGLAHVDLLAGDRQRATERMQWVAQSMEDLTSVPDRWAIAIELGELLARSGAADQALTQLQAVLPALHDADYPWLESLALTGLAEAHAVMGNLEATHQYVKAAEQTANGECWYVNYRLTMLEAVIAHIEQAHDQAHQILIGLHEQALTRGDILVQVLIDDLLRQWGYVPVCEASTCEIMRLENGLRGATMEWLVRGLPTNDENAEDRSLAWH
ncbi:winged helix-turn-helix domain-containing protein [Wenzhouxiangella sp. AB-CW3]|uniref:winged helix-turn-helix domain-containing protein n=1 Tax=Wenzhouxiangella sp. AB-CW3 TaxID=2771012 RepID=UPI001CC2AD36|nr:winged helix-turn-helix domain-containing protein [Wenzhouxiangella sp. AB-CW3]